MAFIDPDPPSLVLRMVYDGPALAGKTTNLEALAEKLGRDIYSGEEADGRTLYLDWVDYLGGSFEGMPIRCQLVSVPGQQVLHSRRRWLLDDADVVVFVADSRPEQAAENVRSFALLQEVVHAKAPAVGIIVQANKRDVDGAVTLDVLRTQLARDQPLAMTEAIATEADGVRDTFVFAVRLALDRVRALRQLGRLETRAPEVQDGPQLERALRTVEAGSSAASATGQAGSANAEASVHAVAGAPAILSQASSPECDAGGDGPDKNRPVVPDVMLPVGQVWPPVRGRILIHEVTRQGPVVKAQPNGSWLAETLDWRLQSPAGGRFNDAAAGQTALQTWIDWHGAFADTLTKERGLALCQDGSGWRLWQIIGRPPTLGRALDQLLEQSDGEALGRGLFHLVHQGRQAPTEALALEDGAWLHLASNGAQDDEAQGKSLRFAGLAPFPGPTLQAARVSEPSDSVWIDAVMSPLRRGLARRPGMVPDVLAGFQAAAEARNQRTVVDSLRQILLGS